MLGSGLECLTPPYSYVRILKILGKIQTWHHLVSVIKLDKINTFYGGSKMRNILFMLSTIIFTATSWSQTTGKLSGVVTGDNGEPLAGANVLVVGTGSGASSDADGTYQILNIPAGSYTIKATYIGYSSKEINGVRVISGLSTETNFTLATSTIEGDVVQVTAEMPLIQKDETSSINVVTSEQLGNMPIRNLDAVLATMPGVVVQNNDVHIRGGRDNEVAYYLNG